MSHSHTCVSSLHISSAPTLNPLRLGTIPCRPSCILIQLAKSKSRLTPLSSLERLKQMHSRFSRFFLRLRTHHRAQDLKRIKPHSQRPRITPTKATTMAASVTAAAVYAATLSSPAAIDAVPENAKDKKHHRQNGKGFVNPWESAKVFSGPYIMAKALTYDSEQTPANSN